MLLLAVLLAVATPAVPTSEEIIPVLNTGTGSVCGSVQNILNNSVYTFTGIPYAIPPVGELRFRKPRPIRPWDGILDATKKPPACYQHQYDSKAPWPSAQDNMSEDCLYLNLWIPQISSEGDERGRAIMVWIYGGAFYSGSASLDLYDGGILAAYGGVIVITINYRVGVFGFLKAKVRRAPGNMGMLDQRLAFQWIKNNAKSFGGDPERITIIGESAGSVSVGLHLLSPMSHGLFARAIMQSGSPYHPVLKGEVTTLSMEKSERLSRTVRCSDGKRSLLTNPNDVVACLRSRNASDLSKAEGRFVEAFMMWFLPSSDDDFLPIDAITALKEMRFNRTDLLGTMTSNEGAIFAYLMLSEAFNTKEIPSLTVEQGRDLITKVFISMIPKPSPSEIADYYLNGLEDGVQVAEAVIRSLGDSFFNCPMSMALEAFANKGGPVYFYALDHLPLYSPWEPWMAMAHFDDIQYTFGNPLKDENCHCEEEEQMSRMVMTLLTSFAKTGKPSLPDGTTWPDFHRFNRTYLEVKLKEQTVKTGPYTENCEFWRNFF